MKIFIAGGTGVIGVRLIPLMIEAGHTVVGMTRTATGIGTLEELGATAITCDVYDRPELIRRVRQASPELVVHELTDLPDTVEQLAGSTAANSRMRREGTDNLLDAARQGGATRFVAQSIAWEPTTEDAADAKRHLEANVLAFGGVVVRYGQLYGPGTYYENALPEPPHVHVARAARRTVEILALHRTTITILDSADTTNPAGTDRC